MMRSWDALISLSLRRQSGLRLLPGSPSPRLMFQTTPLHPGHGDPAGGTYGDAGKSDGHLYLLQVPSFGRVGAWALRAASQEEMGQNTGLKFWCQLCQGTVEPSLQSQERSPKVVQSNLSGISDWAPGAPPTPCEGHIHISACSLCPLFTSTITCPGGHFPLTQRAALV